MIMNIAHIVNFNLIEIIMITIPIWDTEENAITDLISVSFRHVNPTITAPTILNEIHNDLNCILVNKVMNRIIPRPPNFNRIPAKIIDPNTGASTCAKGNQRCILYIGNFTKNPKVKHSDIMKVLCLTLELVSKFLNTNGENKFNVNSIITIGTDEIIV